MAAPRAGQAYTIGFTGAPGAGKSTLTSATIGHLRSLGLEIAVIAIDPSSPFTGGAILGDRVRMQDHHRPRGVHPFDGDSRPPRRALARHTGGHPAARCRRA
ncbi:MAG: hypothetical protein R2705_12225 [Ilumatobacteraceae bacterium]